MPHSMAKAFPTASFPVNAMTDCTLHPSPPARSVFAVMVSMPMHHRVACLRDDVVFFIFLYQRWLYPVDKRRANEFGFAYERDNDEDNADVGACTAEREAGDGGSSPAPELLPSASTGDGAAIGGEESSVES